jgi:hypothetical protein
MQKHVLQATIRLQQINKAGLGIVYGAIMHVICNSRIQSVHTLPETRLWLLVQCLSHPQSPEPDGKKDRTEHQDIALQIAER